MTTSDTSWWKWTAAFLGSLVLAVGSWAGGAQSQPTLSPADVRGIVAQESQKPSADLVEKLDEIRAILVDIQIRTARLEERLNAEESKP